MIQGYSIYVHDMLHYSFLYASQLIYSLIIGVEQYMVEQYIAIQKLYNMFCRVMAKIVQYHVRLMLLVELPASDLLCTCVMCAFIAFEIA